MEAVRMEVVHTEAVHKEERRLEVHDAHRCRSDHCPGRGGHGLDYYHARAHVRDLPDHHGIGYYCHVHWTDALRPVLLRHVPEKIEQATPLIFGLLDLMCA